MFRTSRKKQELRLPIVLNASPQTNTFRSVTLVRLLISMSFSVFICKLLERDIKKVINDDEISTPYRRLN